MRVYDRDEDNTDETEWHDWFAWYPVRFDYEHGKVLVWLETVERKRWTWFSDWQYRLRETHESYF